MNSDSITIRQPDDMHLHVRDGAAMASVIGHSAREFARALIMPNLRPPVVSVADALAYRARIISQLPPGTAFNPLMSLYLTDRTSPDVVDQLAASDHVHAVKYYPAGATTNSDSGVTRIEAIYPALERMAELGVPLLIHGEVTDSNVDIFDREAVFIDTVLAPLLVRFPGLRVVLEHITTKNAAQFVADGTDNLAATITAHHLLMNRNALFAGGLRPHHYCLPVLKREQHRQALVQAATSGSAKFFLGTDSAPHPRGAKHSECGCAGIYTAHAALAFYAEVFEAESALDRLEAFASEFGARFYGLPLNEGQITLSRNRVSVPGHFELDDDVLVPMRAGGDVGWQVGPV